MAWDKLKKLHTTMIDNVEGYEKAVVDAEHPKVKALFAEMLALKRSNHAELHSALTKMGEAPDESGSFMATVHKTVIGVRAATTGLEENSLPSFISGEEQVLEEYRDAITECSGQTAVLDILNKQRANLADKIAKMKTMAK